METVEETELCFPQLLNASCRKAKQSQSVAILIYTALSSISLFTVTLNLLVIISISLYKQLHTATNFLLLSLAVSDFFVGLLMLLHISLTDGCWFLGDIVCTVWYVSDYTLTSVSVGTMVLISVDRYVAICDPLNYATKITQERVQVCVCLCWICSIIFHCVRFRNNLKQIGGYNYCIGQCVVVLGYVEGVVDLFFSFIGPVTVIVVLYMRVFVVVVSQARAIRSQTVVVSLQCSVKVTAKKSEVKAAVTLGVVVIVFLICVCPYFCAVLTGQNTMLNASTSAFVIWLFYFNSCVNPIVYVCFYSWFRKYLKLILTCKRFDLLISEIVL